MLINHEKEIQIAKEPEDDDDYDKDKMQKKTIQETLFQRYNPLKKKKVFFEKGDVMLPYSTVCHYKLTSMSHRRHTVCAERKQSVDC